MLFVPIEYKGYIRGGESIYYNGPHELSIIGGGPQNQLILS